MGKIALGVANGRSMVEIGSFPVHARVIGRKTVIVRYSFTIFLSAFLLFQVQPMIGKYILPWFGGGPAVWTTCMLFFQMLLLVGYLYAHLLSTSLTPRRQAVAHLVLLLVTFTLLPVAPSTGWKPTSDESPIAQILLLLLATVGGPYFLLSSTGPLMQRWFSWTFVGRSPYRLYALSNVGSLLALVSYPFVFEPTIRLYDQVFIWSAAYVIFGVGLCWCAWKIIQTQPTTDETKELVLPIGKPRAVSKSAAVCRMLLWVGLAACGSICLLATTNQLCMDVAPVPFLWVAPLSVYLLTFVITFDNPRWYDRRLFGTLLVVSAVAGCWLVQQTLDAPIPIQVTAYLFVMFACCMACHGELVRSRPDPRYLTRYYLLISLGGAIGGLFTAVVAPLWFTGFWEYHVALAGCCILTGIAWCWDRAWLNRTSANGMSETDSSRIMVADWPVKVCSFDQSPPRKYQWSTSAMPFWIGVIVSIFQCWIVIALVYMPHLDVFLPMEHTILLGVIGLIHFLVWIWSARSDRVSWWTGVRTSSAVVQLIWLVAFMYWRHPGILSVADIIWLALGILGSNAAGLVANAWLSRVGWKFRLVVIVGGLQMAILCGVVWLICIHEISIWQAAWFGVTYCVTQASGILFARLWSRSYLNDGTWYWAPLASMLTLMSIYLYGVVQDAGADVEYSTRNFYGVLQVSLVEDILGEQYSLNHGQIEHGFQYVDDWMRFEPTGYYGYDSGIGLAISQHPRRCKTQGLSVGVVGLGVGTLASYGRRGDRFCFYEINPEVRSLSDRYFTYLDDSPAEKEILMGDARILMEREVEQGVSREFDILAIDAFSGDSIPVHLLTSECINIYRHHLKPDGILAIHISNRYLDLNPVCRALAQHLGWKAIRVDTEDDDSIGNYSAIWILLTNNREFLELPTIKNVHWPWESDEPAPLLWTDDFASLWQVLK